MRFEILVLVFLIVLMPGCSKPVGSWDANDVERYLIRNVSLESVELQEVSYGTYEGTATRSGEICQIAARLDPNNSLTWSTKGEATGRSISGEFVRVDQTPMIFRIAWKAIAFAFVMVSVFFLEKQFGQKVVAKWGIIMLLALAVLAVALMILNLVQG